MRSSRWAVGLLVVLLATLVGSTTAWSVNASEPSANLNPDIATQVAGEAIQRTGDLNPAPTSNVSVVRVSATACGARSTGSGFVVADGLVMTAAHVVGDAKLVRVDMGSTTGTGEVLGRFADDRDIAIIAIPTPSTSAPRASTLPDVGDPVTIVGYPGGGVRVIGVGARVDLAPQVAGRVIGNTIGVASRSGLGFSGGPAIDGDGNLFGMVVAAEIETDTTIVVAFDRLGDVSAVPLAEGSCAPVG